MASLENIYKKIGPRPRMIGSGIGVGRGDSGGGTIPNPRLIGSGIGVGRGESSKGSGGSNEPIKPLPSSTPGIDHFPGPSCHFLGTGIGVGR